MKKHIIFFLLTLFHVFFWGMVFNFSFVFFQPSKYLWQYGPIFLLGLLLLLLNFFSFIYQSEKFFQRPQLWNLLAGIVLLLVFIITLVSDNYKITKVPTDFHGAAVGMAYYTYHSFCFLLFFISFMILESVIFAFFSEPKKRLKLTLTTLGTLVLFYMLYAMFFPSGTFYG